MINRYRSKAEFEIHKIHAPFIENILKKAAQTLRTFQFNGNNNRKSDSYQITESVVALVAINSNKSRI